MDKVYSPSLIEVIFAANSAHTATRTPTGAIGLMPPPMTTVQWLSRLKRWRPTPIR